MPFSAARSRWGPARERVPFHAMKAPLLSTRMQNVVDAHETAFSWPWVSQVRGLGPAMPSQHGGAALGGDAEGGRHARDLVGGAQAPRLPDQPEPS